MRHWHISYSTLKDGGRLWRAGRTALDRGYAREVFYLGHRVPEQPDREVRGPGETIVRLGPWPGAVGRNRLQRVLTLPNWYRAVSASLAPQADDLIVAHSLSCLPVAVALKRRYRVKLLFDAHELESEREGWSKPARLAARAVETALIRACDHTIVVSPSILDWYKRTYPGLSVSLVRNVPVSFGERGPSALRADIGVSEDVLLTVYVGAFGRGRGLELAIETFKNLGPERHLALIGFGPLTEQLKAAAVAHANIHVLPAVPHDRLVNYVGAADIGLFVPEATSLSYWYSLPNKLFEYAAAGLACIVGPGPDLQSFITESQLGWSIPTKPEALRALLAGQTRASVRARVAQSSYSPPTWAIECERLIEVYSELGLKPIEPLGPQQPPREEKTA